MCGILGVVAPYGSLLSLDQRTLVRMRDTMESRGPDDAGLVLSENVGFGHRRLAIRDLEGGAQPWSDEEQNCLLVYNGELYNDNELRKQLEQRGHRFRSHCDTEVLARAYLEWGFECLSKLNGDFAFGVYDFRDHSLFLARDRCGVKPLYFAEVNNNLIFASSVTAILAHPDFVKRPNYSAISHYLTTFRLTLGRETMYENIWLLQPGEFLKLKGEQLQIGSYWDYPLQERQGMQYLEAVDELEQLLELAVSDRLVSDVPVGMFLSGGVDSNTIACLLNRHLGSEMQSQCGGSAEPRSEDFDFARRCAEHVGFEHNEVKVGPGEYRDHWSWLIGEQGLPLATPTDVIIYRIAQEMKKNVGVALGGEGADELMCGYTAQHWSGFDYERAMNLNRTPHHSQETFAFRQSLQRQYGRDHFESEVDHYLALNSLIPVNVKPGLLRPHIWQAAEQDRNLVGYYQQTLQQWGDLPTRRKYMLLLHRINLESLLSRLDSATMQASLEARVPFTDVRLLEQVFRVPQRFKIDMAHGIKAPHLASAELDQKNLLQSKRILRSVAGRLMPEELAQRKKASFPTGVQVWFSGAWTDWAGETLRSSPFAQELFQPAALNEISENPQQAGMWLWPMLNVAMWGDRHLSAA